MQKGCYKENWDNFIRKNGFPDSSVGKESAYNAGDPGSIPGLGRSPGEGNGDAFQFFLPGKSHGQRSLMGYSLYGVVKSWTPLSN